MADISKINSSQLNKIFTNPKKPEQEPSSGSQVNVNPEAGQTNFKGVSAEDVLNSMALAGMQNQIQHGIATVNPSKYLTQERINEIAGSMIGFLGQTEKMKASFDEEFGHLPEYKNLSEDKKFEMVADAFARMNG